MNSSRVSAVICSLNSAQTIRQCITSLATQGLHEIIVVDGGSTDGTVELIESSVNEILFDGGRGLGRARNLGIEAASGDYVLNWGPDNFAWPDSINQLVAQIESLSFTGMSMRTVVVGGGLWGKALNFWRAKRFPPGCARVIGTPTLYPRHVLKQYPFSVEAIHSDDSELCERLRLSIGAQFAISPTFCLEIGKDSFTAVLEMFFRYGYSDAEIYRAGRANGWSLRRKLTSIFHPLRRDVLVPLRSANVRETFLFGIPLTVFCLLRYLGWWRAASRIKSSTSII